MANTTYMNLGKLAGTENMKTYPPVQADNADKIDAGFGASFDATRNVKSVTDALADAIAIVATGNTHAAITAGQYVYVKQHNSLSEGLYVATSNIAANATLSGSNLTADSSGGLNALNGNMANMLKMTKPIDGGVPATTTFSYLSKSFTLAKPAIVSLAGWYSSQPCSAIGISTSNSAFTNGNVGYSENADFNSQFVTTLLSAGTYYIWGKGKVGTANIGMTLTILEFNVSL